MTPEQAIEFAPKLPRGWLATAQEKLRAKGHEFSDGHISKVKNGHSQNDTIEGVLFEIAEKEAARRAATTARIANLN